MDGFDGVPATEAQGPASCLGLESEHDTGEIKMCDCDALPGKINRLAEAKNRDLAFAEYIRVKVPPQVRPGLAPRPWAGVMAFLTCSPYLVARKYYGPDQVEIEARFCNRHLLCQTCAIRRANRAIARAMNRLALLPGNPDRRYYMLTLTIKSRSDFVDAYAHLVSSMRRLFKRRSSGKDTFFNHLLGGMSSVELKRGKGSGLWHPHCHMVVSCDHDLPVKFDRRGVGRCDDLSAEWRAITGDSSIVELHPLRTASGDCIQPGAEDSGQLLDALLEVYKYAVKLGELDCDDRWMVVRALCSGGSHRLLSTFGEFWGLGLDDDSAREARQEEKFQKRSGSPVSTEVYQFDPAKGYDLRRLEFGYVCEPVCDDHGVGKPTRRQPIHIVQSVSVRA